MQRGEKMPKQNWEASDDGKSVVTGTRASNKGDAQSFQQKCRQVKTSKQTEKQIN